MKILILYVPAGRGHQKAAEVIRCDLGRRLPDARLELVNALDKTHGVYRSSYVSGYDFLVKHAQWFWALIFGISCVPGLRTFSKRVHRCLNRFHSRELEEFITGFSPQVVISTHFFTSDIVSSLKQRRLLDSRLVTVITDFGVHPFWVVPETDIYAVAGEAARRQLTGMGIPDSGIRVTGIPIDSVFSERADRTQVAAKIGIDPGRFTVLVVTGSFGIGPIEKICEYLHGECQMLAVCARNTGLFERLTARRLPNVKVFGFVDNIAELMSAADCIVTKAGGLTISELLARGLVPIFISAIPGQEKSNVAILRAAGVGEYARSASEVKRYVLKYKNDAAVLERTRAALVSFRTTNTLEKIYGCIR